MHNGVQDLVDELQDPACFGWRGDRVEILQTHISVVCLCGDRAWKFKKTVRLPFVDFTTLAIRKAACEDELRLNRRLCPDVYLAVEPLRRTADGLRVGPGTGEVVEWCVVMVRLPQERMLDVLLRQRAVGPSDVDGLAQRIAAFHRDAARGPDVAAAGAPDVLVENVRANFREAAAHAGPVFDAALLECSRRRTEAEVPDALRALRQRAREGAVVEGHGDLHARNVCLIEPPAIYDCVEFRLDFRAGDVACDIAFLAMDLRYRGHPDLAERFVATYRAASSDAGLDAVLPFCVRYRAMVRAKVAAVAAADPGLSEADRAGAREAARRHLRLCAWTFVEADGPLLVITCGLPACGKSTLAMAVAEGTGWRVVRTDVVRKELAGVPPDQPLPEAFYGAEATQRTYAETLRRAVEDGGFALADGNFRARALRARAVAAARARGMRCAIVWIEVPGDVARERLRARRGDASDADEGVFERLEGTFEPPSADEADRLVRLDGTQPTGVLCDALARALACPEG